MPEVAHRRVRLRGLMDEERIAVAKLAQSRAVPAERVVRARMIWHCLNEQKGIAIKRSRLGELLVAEGLCR